MWFAVDWPAPANVRAISTDRLGGESVAPYESLNLGDHVGDEPAVVLANRAALSRDAGLPNEPAWLNQVHGTDVVCLPLTLAAPDADASYSAQAEQVCTVMTADCLPVLFCNADGTEVAAAHAGWRGLLDGVLEATLSRFQASPDAIMAWMGPAIGPKAFEVGPEVRAQFIARDASAAEAFVARPNGKYLADLYALARQRLLQAGVTRVYGGEACTFSDPERFFSYRRDGQTGRQASLIWFTTP
ncbi:peptidoglycan editing factor PgeF [Ferrimonas balearica]|uniref:peptidoglycan editing factor PgeF n=1 Tax=Ferrimonas balearica TaxID=44012 RepID=UPI001C580DA9|nr:peptidoglycan editing factor PgeF [Ferrimonas balearica]MBW3165208.1 peptidoglycan editing factor PgeF [Ferrimonas balearica]